MTARAAKRKVNLTPERTDMTDEQMQELMDKPIEDVMEMTKEELRDYADDMAAKGLGGTIDLINEEIRNAETASLPDENDIQSTPVAAPRRSRKKKSEDDESID